MAIEVEKLDVLDHRTMLAQSFAIINAMQVEPEARADLPSVSLVPSRFTQQAKLFPLLVELRALGDTERVGLIDRMAAWRKSRGTPYFSALLDCSDDAVTLRRLLVARCDVRLPDGTRDVLRLHDPRVFGHLSWILQPPQLGALLGNIHRWTWQAPDANWLSLVNPEASPAARAASLRIDVAQWAQLSRLADINAVLATLRREAPQLEDGAVLARKVDARLADAARDFSGATADDRRLYAIHALRFGAPLFRHPAMQTALNAARTGKQGYFSACAGFDDETLQAWAASIELSKECA